MPQAVISFNANLLAMEKALASSSTATRNAQLRELEGLVAIRCIDQELLVLYLELLFGTHALYHDRRSRKTVQRCLATAIDAGATTETLLVLARMMYEECEKPGIAASSAFVLVEWCSVFMQHLAASRRWQSLSELILLAHAEALEKCLQPNSRNGLVRSALSVSRRGFRKLFAPSESRNKNLQMAVSALTAKGNQPMAKNAPLLGVIAGVCARQSALLPLFEAHKPQYREFYVREIVNSRAPLPEHLTSGLSDFFAHFINIDELEKDVIPAIEKGLLRAPEVILEGVLRSLATSLPAVIDLSATLSGKLLKPLLAAVKSSNHSIVKGVIRAYRPIARHCSDLQTMDSIVVEIANPLASGKLASPEQRVLHAKMLEATPLSEQGTRSVTSTLVAVASKEGNEAALTAEATALTRCMLTLLKSEKGVDKPVIDSLSKCLDDKKASSRRLWMLRVGEALRSLVDFELRPGLIDFVDAVIPKLITNFEEVVSNAAAAAQSGILVGAFILVALTPALQRQFPGSTAIIALTKAAVLTQAMSLVAKQAFLLNARIYHKIGSAEELLWLSRALASVMPKMDESTDKEVTLAWSDAITYLITAKNAPSSLQQEATTCLSTLYIQKPKAVFRIIVEGLWANFASGGVKRKESKWAPSNLINVLKAICPDSNYLAKREIQIDVKILESQACALPVLARHELIPRSSWIDMCLRMSIDPGKLAHDRLDELLQEVERRTELGSQSETIKKAACNAAAELAFVAPDVVIPRLIKLVSEDLDVRQIRDFGPVEAAIFRTPEGTCFVDVLSKQKQSKVPNKNDRDYDILKWEDELRAQLELKKGQQRKLTPEETSKVNAQLKKESQIRESVHKAETRLMRGVGFINSLATGPPTDATLWLGTAVKLLLGISNAGAGLIIGDEAFAAYIACSRKVTARLGFMRQYIGVATLRALGFTDLEGHGYERLEDLATRVLYRLRFAGEQLPFDVVSLIYILPLILAVLTQGGFGDTDDDRNAQLVLVLEFLSFHTHVCEDEALPRAELLAAFVQAMQNYAQHYKLVKDCFADACRCTAPNMSHSEMMVLAKGAIVPQAGVRTTVLQSISAEVDMSDMSYSDEIWLACHDAVTENNELGKEIWEESGFQLDATVPLKMVPYLESGDTQLRGAAARALASSASSHKECLGEVIPRLKSMYLELAKPKLQQLDEFGMPRKMDLSDPWEARHGVATAFKELVGVVDKTQMDDLFDFLIESGPLGDKNDGVRREMLEAAIRAADVHGRDMIDELMKKFERILEQPDKGSDAADRVNEAVIIIYGAVAQHLKPGDSKLPIVIERLLATLSTPSETVQYAIAECLPPLVRACADKSSKYFELVVDRLLNSKKYATQRGAAYGLAGLVLGRGVSTLRDYRIMSMLNRAMENKKDANQREAAMLGFELFSTMLGRLFEPYVIQVVPLLLSGFGDTNGDVRDACLAAAKACFGKLSSYGVKKIMPTLLEGLEDPLWRSKRGACDLLGAMAYLDPNQLANSLPDIIPPLSGVLNDSHKEVRAAANRSLKRFGEVINNPEIKGLVDVLLKAISDPTKYGDEALESLIKVQFIHYLDAPSLALIARILQRGLGGRSSTKRKAAQVIGSLAHLTEKKDIVAHLPILVAGLKSAAVDPVPTTRATASRALGSLVEKLGEDALPDLIPGLMQTLKSDTGAGDRLGSAQALSEVLAGLGTGRLEETLPTILQNVESPTPSVREGFMSLFIFLPVCFGNSFSNYLGRIVPPILAGLADEVESIRETALRAGRLLVKNFAMRAIDLLLPELERGLADDSYRIRLSSVELVGDLLFNLTGVKAAAENEDEADEADDREAGVSLKEVLGEEKRNKILSALYVCRCDTAGAVRSAAMSVWKVLVPSPRTLKELVPTLTQLLIKRLGSSHMEHKVIASNALGELIRKAGDGVLSSLLPTLEQGLQASTDSDAKQGICLALRELISSASPEALEGHEKTLISVVRTALTDSDEEVREVAAEAFDSLQQILGKRAVDQVLPHLLSLLRSEKEAENALSALLTLLTETTRSNMILPNLIPTLISPPISAFNAKALASLSRVAGAAMNRRLPNIINSLMDNEIKCQEDDLRTELEASFDMVIQSIDEYDGLNTVMNVLLGLLKHEDHRRRASTARHLGNFFSETGVNYSRYNQDIIRSLLISFDDGDQDVVQAAWTALSQLTKKLRKEEMESLVVSTRQALQRVGVAGANLRGFELPKGISAILPIFLQGLMNGTTEQKVQAALGMSDIVDRASETALKPFVTQMTGPLIRIVSERATDVKAAILLTLNNLLNKMPTALKPFLPQLQRTFAKSLADPSSELLRSRAARALGTLIKYTPRIDPLVGELVTGSKTTDVGVKTAMLKALFEVISRAGSNMGEASRSAVLSLIDMEADERDDKMTVTNAKLLGALIKNVPEDAATSLLKNRVLTTHMSNSSAVTLNAVLVESPETLLQSAMADELPNLLCLGVSNKSTYIADNFILATGKVLLSSPPKSFESTKKVFEALAKVIEPGNPADSRRLALVIVRTLSRTNMDMVRPHVALLAPPIFASVRDLAIPVKLAAEAAFVELFSVADEESRVFDKFMAGAGAHLPANTKRSMGDYFKRVAVRLGTQARERREAEGGQGGLGLSNDEQEDEKEIWSVGKLEASAETFS
ncbi:50S ribosomal protein L19e [Ophiocordyceps camponoti-floridani]|uniref:eIF-2-alpha kinase activator GCN1 n=1 Tax=Ophiocordyceps camponoti-floridani TaxID=2030778 RepID=A0A8H4QD03_9HYPO|nr:50S ribosomal protein L19e [Ophiocordyceps camponoti-floridani]